MKKGDRVQGTGLTIEQILDSGNIEGLILNAISMQKRRAWHLKEAEDFLNNSSASMLQHERDARDIIEQIKKLK